MAPIGGMSSTEVVSSFLGRLEQEGRRFVTKDELGQLRPALDDLYLGLMRVRRMGGDYAKVDFSEPVWGLMGLAGRKAEPVMAKRSVLQKIAASFFTL